MISKRKLKREKVREGKFRNGVEHRVREVVKERDEGGRETERGKEGEGEKA